MEPEMDVSDEEESFENQKKPNFGFVSTLYKCETKEATTLVIYDLAHKLSHSSHYDIGGTYFYNIHEDAEPEFWFYYTTSLCQGHNYLLNLFVCHRKHGNFSIGVSNSSDIKHQTVNKKKQSTLPDTLMWYSFSSGQCNENHYIKTFCFTDSDLKEIEKSTVYIPLAVKYKKYYLNSDIVKSIKLEHDLSSILSKNEKSDFILESTGRKQYPAHKILLAAHSPVLRDLMKNATVNSLLIDIDDKDMDLLLQFIYTGTIKDLHDQDCSKLLEIADKFQLKQLFDLMHYVVCEQINENNAVEMAVISKKYKMEQLQNKVFDFIKSNPCILKSDNWKELKDVELIKCLFQYIHTG